MKKHYKNESDFQKDLKKELKQRYPGCIVQKEDAIDIQGIPDLIILYGSRWATLECKESERATRRPNQDHYVNKMNEMSFSRFIYPENCEETLLELDRFFNYKEY